MCLGHIYPYIPYIADTSVSKLMKYEIDLPSHILLWARLDIIILWRHVDAILLDHLRKWTITLRYNQINSRGPGYIYS